MKTVNLSLYIVVYNFIIGVLVMTSSEKFGIYAGHLIRFRRAQAVRLTRIATFTFGACVAILSGGIYLISHVAKLY